MSDAAENARIRSLRPPKPAVDPWRPHDVVLEGERDSGGITRSSMTVFLSGSECPFTCVYCDLWQYTLDRPTPPGAIPRQLEIALASIGEQPVPDAIKLYNASNFFEPRAVPTEDLETIAGQLRAFQKVTVECHPRLVGPPCLRFAELLRGDLEIAMGLETIHPVALPRLNKEMTLTDFEVAVELLREGGVGARAFVLLSPPFVPADESVEWTLRSVDFALDRGVDVVSIIPMRMGAGEMERLAAAGLFEPPTLKMFDAALAAALALSKGVVLADLWDIEAIRGCGTCRGRRIKNLKTMNQTGVPVSPPSCPSCGDARRGGE